MLFILSAILLLILCAVLWRTKDARIVKVRKGEVFNFKTSLDLTGLPIVTFQQGDKKYNFILDSGANVSSIHSKISIEKEIIEGSDDMSGLDGTNIKCNLAMIKLQYKEKEYEHLFRTVDLSDIFEDIYKCTNVRVVGLIGGDFMAKYNYCLDYCEYIAYARKK